jgi:PPOX class probable F420-dependent enzyme
MTTTTNTTKPSAWEPFVRPRTALLTTHRRDDSPVTTPVDVAVDGPHAYFRTWDASGKAKRLRRDPRVEVAPRSHGHAIGDPVPARVRVLEGDDVARARRALHHKHPLRQGVLVPLMHRVRRWHTVHYELEP